MTPKAVETPKGPVRAILYERVSTAEQRKGFSLQVQHGDLKGYCDRMGYRIVRAYRETGKRRDMSRDALQRLLTLAEGGLYDVVVVWRRDRFGAGRDVEDVERFLKERGVRVEAMMVGPQPHTSVTKFTNRIMDAVADFELDTTTERTTAARLEKARQGKWPTCLPPGWTRTYPAKEVILDEAVAREIRGIYHAVVAGRNLREVARAYGISGHLTVMHRIHNPAYKGTGLYAGIPVPLPAIVSVELWDAAQRALEHRKRNRTDEERKRGAGPLPGGSPPPRASGPNGPPAIPRRASAS